MTDQHSPGRCRDCKFWITTGHMGAGGQGQCERVDNIGRWSLLDEKTSAFFVGHDEAALYTAPTFGCSLFEANVDE